MKGIKTLSARTSGLMRLLSVLACIALLLTSAGPLVQRAVAQETLPFDSIRVRVEGYLKATHPEKWLIGEHFIMINTQTTTIIEKRGQAEVGAWVVAWCLRDDKGSLTGEVIQVERPAGRAGPDLQFSGQVMKQNGEWWVVGDLLVRVTQNTTITGAPGLNWLVWVVAKNRETFFEALAIEAIAESPDLLPVEFEGVIEALEPGGGRINGRTFTLAANPEIIGTLCVGCSVEMRATLASNGVLVARWIKVVTEPAAASFSAVVTEIIPEDSGGQTWAIALLPDSASGRTTPGTLHISPDTLVDESQAVAQTGARAEIRGTEFAQGEIQADTVRVAQSLPAQSSGALAAAATPDHTEPQMSAQAATTAIAPWSTPSPIASGLTSATHPVLAYTNDGVTHALWESGGSLFYAARAPGSTWSQARNIAAGFDPVLIVDSAGKLHAIFANEFNREYNIFHCHLAANGWTHPTNVSRTSGRSEKPVAAAGTDGKLYVAWMDNTPDEWVTYFATWSGSFWSNQPLANGAGQAPAIAVTRDNQIFVAWQDRFPTPENPTGTFDIFVSERRAGNWSLPINVSDSGKRNAIGVSLSASADGLAQLVWIEDGLTVRYGYGQGVYWPNVQTVAQAAITARGVRVAIENGDTLHIAWDEGALVRTVSAPKASISWPKPEVISALQGEITDVGLTVGQRPGAGVTLIWVQTAQPETVEVYESHRRAATYQRLWLPLLR